MLRKIVFGVITILISVIICCTGGEIIVRAFYKSPHPGYDERNILHRYDEELGWFPLENAKDEYMGSHLIRVAHNQMGFRDIEHGAKTKKRIAFVGDSFVWGYDAQQDELFTEQLRPLLPEWDVINMGVSGYGTDQELLLIKRWFDQLQPDVVCLVFFSENDFYENSSNRVYDYYKPYFTQKNNELILNGTPVPISKRYFSNKYPLLHKSKLIEFLFNISVDKRPIVDNKDPDLTLRLILEMRDFVTAKGASFFIAFAAQADEEQSCTFCEEEKIEHLFLTNDMRFEGNGNHWTSQGHEFVAKKLYDFITSPDRSF